jgi:hypothetical protein
LKQINEVKRIKEVVLEIQEKNEKIEVITRKKA